MDDDSSLAERALEKVVHVLYLFSRPALHDRAWIQRDDSIRNYVDDYSEAMQTFRDGIMPLKCGIWSAAGLSQADFNALLVCEGELESFDAQLPRAESDLAVADSGWPNIIMRSKETLATIQRVRPDIMPRLIAIC